jgi:OmpA-OmpF porin, OOP family
MIKRIGRIAVAACVAASASGASAQWYAGATIGAADGGVDAGRISGQLVNDLGFFSASTSTDDTDMAWRAFVGYQVLPWLAVEGAYIDAGKSKWASTVTPAGTIDASLRTRALSLGLAARYEFNPALSVYGRVSAAWTRTKGSFSSSGFVELANTGRTERRTVPAYAAGIEYTFAPRVSARLEYERLSRVSSDELGGKFDIDMIGIGVRYSY